MRDDARRFGWPKVLYRAVMGKCEGFLQLYRISSRALAVDATFEPTVADVRIATEQELRVAVREMPKQLTTDFVDGAMARGDACLAAFLDGRMVAFSWRSYSLAPHTHGIWVRFNPSYRYGYKSFTLPEYRGRHLLDLRRGDPYCRSRGAQRTIGFIASHNLESLQRSARISNVFIGYAGYLRLFGRFWFFRTRRVRQAGFEFFVR